MSAPKITIAPSLGDAIHVGFMRSDLAGVFHTIARAKGGEAFEPWSHFPCDVCAAHEISIDDLRERLDELLDRAPVQRGADKVISCSACGRPLASTFIGGYELCGCLSSSKEEN